MDTDPYSMLDTWPDEMFFQTSASGEIYWDHENIAAWLLLMNVCYLIDRTIGDTTCNEVYDPPHKTSVLYVNCNDTFIWGCADGEGATEDDLVDLWKEVHAEPIYGSTIWICKKRNEKPQKPIEYAMRKAGAWTEEMENLPDNLYWKDKEYNGEYN